MGMPPARISLVYSHTGLRKFLQAIGPAHTAELFHTGQNIDSARAAEIGLVNHVVAAEELERHSIAMAEGIAANAPLSLEGNKRVMRVLLEAGAQLDPERERELVELRESCFRSEDFREGIASFAEKRPPKWKGR
jgi:enoyl-CoA hydratase/carnithine racemase